MRKGDNYLDDVQVVDFLKYVLETEPLIYQAMAFVTAYGGLRKGEVLGINWSDLSFVNNTIEINKAYARAANNEFIKSPKNSTSNRTIVVPDIVMKLLKELKLSSDSTRVFPLKYNTPSRWFKRVRDRYNKTHDNKLPTDMTYHGLRHTSATLLIAQGLDIKTVSARLGHADTTTTMNIYAHAIKSRDQAASNALESLLGFGTEK